jgi:DNA-binding transcriptional MerR regulator
VGRVTVTLTFQRQEGVRSFVKGGEPSAMQTQRSDRADKPRLAATDRLTIGQAAHLSGVGAKAIRYYEAIGLLPRPRRGSNRYRRYGMADVNRLLLLRRIQLLGVPLSTAKALLFGASDARCVEVREDLLALVDTRLQALDREIAELHLLRTEVESYQRALAACHPDERETFSACRDMRCIAADGDGRDQEEEDASHGAL